MSQRVIPRAALVLGVGAALTVVLAGVKSLSDIIGPVFLALILTVTVHPLRAWLRRRRLPDWAASITMVVTVYVLLAMFCLALTVSIGRLAVLVPTYADDATQLVQDGGKWLADLGVGADQVAAVTAAFDPGSLVKFATELLSGVLGVLTNLFFIATLLIFMAFDTVKVTHSLSALHDRRPELIEALTHFAQGARSYMAVSAGFGLVVAVIDTVALSIIGVPGAFVWGVLAFVTNFVPNIGFVIGIIPPALIGLLEGGPSMMIAVIVVYSAINVSIQSVIQPKFVGDAVGLTTTLTFLSLAFWAWVLGALGALLAVPLTLFLKALLIEADPAAHWLLPLISGKPDAVSEPTVPSVSSKQAEPAALGTAP